MVTIGFALASAVSSWIGGSLVNRLGRPLVVSAASRRSSSASDCCVLAALVHAARGDAVGRWRAPWCIAGIGGGLVISPNQTLALADIPVKQGGLAGSVGQLGQRIGTAVGTAVALSLFYSTIYRETGAATRRPRGLPRRVRLSACSRSRSSSRSRFGVGLLDLGARKRRQRSLA